VPKGWCLSSGKDPTEVDRSAAYIDCQMTESMVKSGHHQAAVHLRRDLWLRVR
jgi:S-adenosylmethionine synthetase